MAKIQIDLSKEEDTIVEIYKLTHDLNSKQDAVKQMIRHFEIDITPKSMKKDDYFQL